MNHAVCVGQQAAVAARRQGDNLGTHRQKFGGHLFGIAGAGHGARRRLAGLQNVGQAHGLGQIGFRAEPGFHEVIGVHIQIEDVLHAGFARDPHRLEHGPKRQLRGFRVEMRGLPDIGREARADLLRRDLRGDVREHVDAALALRVHRNPSDRAELAWHLVDGAGVHAVGVKGVQNGLAVGVVAEQAEPSGRCAATGHLGEIIRGDAAGVDFQTGGGDLIVAVQQMRHEGEEIHGATSQSDNLDLFHLFTQRFSPM